MNTIVNIILAVGITAFIALVGIGVFFFVATRGTLLFRKVLRLAPSSTSHIYPAYSEMWLIKLIDVQPLISAILLFQYPNLVDDIVANIGKTSLRGKRALITSCAFGNVIPRIVDVCNERNIERIIITDIVRNELNRVRGKLTGRIDHIHFMEDNAIAMPGTRRPTPHASRATPAPTAHRLRQTPQRRARSGPAEPARSTPLVNRDDPQSGFANSALEGGTAPAPSRTAVGILYRSYPRGRTLPHPAEMPTDRPLNCK
jgi:hypothetical protein